MNTQTFIETGAYTGNTLCKADYPIKYSIEHDYNLFLYCKNRFIEDDRVRMIHGDSRNVLANLLVSVGKVPVFIFLDASTTHTSALMDELEIVMKHQGDYTIKFDLSNLGKLGKRGVITLDSIRLLVSPVYSIVLYGESTVMLVQNSGSERSASDCSSSDSL